MKQCYIVIDVALCHDCNNCFMACKDEHVGNSWLPYTDEQPRHGHRWMNILRKERGQYPRIDVAYLPMPCQHCADAPCIKANPDCVSRSEDGLVLIDPEKARGRHELVDCCPFGAIYWNEAANVAQKCTMCAHILQGDCWEKDMPRCVHSCPTEALRFYRLEPAEMEAKIREEQLSCWQPEWSGGSAHVYYKNLHRFENAFIAGGLIQGDECAEHVEVTLIGENIHQVQTTDCFGDFKFDNLLPGEYALEINGKTILKATLDASSLNLGTIAI